MENTYDVTFRKTNYDAKYYICFETSDYDCYQKIKTFMVDDISEREAREEFIAEKPTE